MLKQRIFTALILIPVVVLVILFFPPIAFALVLALILGLGIREWTHLIALPSLKKRIGYLIVIEALFFLWLLFFPITLSILFLGLLGWIIALYFLMHYAKFAKFWSENIVARMVIGGFVFIPCWVALNVLRQHPKGPILILILLTLIWAADTGAYFVGRRFGKHKLAPNISPGKTVEGFIGGMILVCIVAAVEGFLLRLDTMQGIAFVCIALLTGFASVVGDLFESLVKRQSGVKDSGQILPGHGGLLDRIDSLLAAAPVFVLGVILFYTSKPFLM